MSDEGPHALDQPRARIAGVDRPLDVETSTDFSAGDVGEARIQATPRPGLIEGQADLDRGRDWDGVEATIEELALVDVELEAQRERRRQLDDSIDQLQDRREKLEGEINRELEGRRARARHRAGVRDDVVVKLAWPPVELPEATAGGLGPMPELPPSAYPPDAKPIPIEREGGKLAEQLERGQLRLDLSQDGSDWTWTYVYPGRGPEGSDLMAADAFQLDRGPFPSSAIAEEDAATWIQLAS